MLNQSRPERSAYAPLTSFPASPSLVVYRPAKRGFADPTAVETIVRVLPALGSLKRSPGEKVALVSQMIVEEVLQDIAVLDFGKGLQSVANVALWRARGDHRPLVGEFAFQLRFKRRDELHRKAMKRCERFFVAVQRAARSRIALGATKTGVVYRLQGNPPRSHE